MADYYPCVVFISVVAFMVPTFTALAWFDIENVIDNVSMHRTGRCLCWLVSGSTCCYSTHKSVMRAVHLPAVRLYYTATWL